MKADHYGPATFAIELERTHMVVVGCQSRGLQNRLWGFEIPRQPGFKGEATTPDPCVWPVPLLGRGAEGGRR